MENTNFVRLPTVGLNRKEDDEMNSTVMQIKTIQAGSPKSLDEQVNKFLKEIPLSLIKEVRFSTNYDVETTIEKFNALIAYSCMPMDEV